MNALRGSSYLLANPADPRSSFGDQSETAFFSAFNKAIRVARGNAASRGDGVTFEQFVAAVNLRVDEYLAKEGIRIDTRTDASGAGPAGGGLGAAALRHVYKEVLEEVRPIPNALRIFAPDTSVALGMKDHEVHRVHTVGEARFWRGSKSQIPTIEMAQSSRVFPIRYIITQILWDVFEEMAENIANIGRLRILAAAARDVLEQLANEVTWFGDDANGLFGVLNYPWVTRVTLNGPSGKAFSLEEDISGVETRAFVQEITRLVQYPTLNSKGAFSPNRIAWGLKLDAFLSSTPLKIGTDGQQITLKDWFYKTNPFIKSDADVDVCQELDDAYGDGVSAIVAYRRDVNTLAVVIPGGGIQQLPMVEEGAIKYQPWFMALGGVVMRRVGDVVVGLVETAPA